MEVSYYGQHDRRVWSLGGGVGRGPAPAFAAARGLGQPGRLARGRAGPPAGACWRGPIPAPTSRRAWKSNTATTGCTSKSYPGSSPTARAPTPSWLSQRAPRGGCPPSSPCTTTAATSTSARARSPARSAPSTRCMAAHQEQYYGGRGLGQRDRPARLCGPGPRRLPLRLAAACCWPTCRRVAARTAARTSDPRNRRAEIAGLQPVGGRARAHHGQEPLLRGHHLARRVPGRGPARARRALRPRRRGCHARGLRRPFRRRHAHHLPRRRRSAHPLRRLRGHDDHLARLPALQDATPTPG